MGRTIDERVVEMRFDNRQFEAGVRTSISSLGKLKESLDMKGAAKGMEEVGAAAKRCDMSALSSAVQGVKTGFSAMEIVGITALTNITNSAINAGKRITAALTIDPVKSGFKEYETQINAVQTIMANTSKHGTTLEQVNTALDELNHYADMTIYNFTEMTRNIGTFTAAGVDLDTSVAAIKGIANLAAVSGSTSQQASTAMYQLSQALAAGTVKLMDWNSVVNAGMGGQVFQDALMETARVHGIAIDQMIKDEGSFRETLSKGWLSSDVLTETLQKFTGDLTEAQLLEQGYTKEQTKAIMAMGETANDAATKVKTFSQLLDTLKEAAQSGWTETWEIFVGDFEEAKKLFTVVSDSLGNMIGASAEARNSILRGAFSSGWEQITKKVEDAGISMDVFKARLIEVGKKHGKLTEEMLKDAGSLEGTLSKGWLNGKIVSETLLSFVDKTAKAAGAAGQMTGSLEELEKAAERVLRGEFGNGAARIEALTKAGYDYAAVQAMVNHQLLGTEFNMDELSDTQLKNIGYTQEQIKMIRELAAQAESTGSSMDELLERIGRPDPRTMVIESVSNALSGLTAVISTVRGAWADIFPPEEASRRIYNIISAIYDFSQKLKVTEEEMQQAGGVMDRLRRTFKGLFSLFDLAGQAVSAVVRAVFPLTEGVGFLADRLLDGTAALGDWISGIDAAARESGIFQDICRRITQFIAAAKEQIQGFFDTIRQKTDFPALNALRDGLSKIKTGGKELSSFEKMVGEAVTKNKELSVEMLRDYAAAAGAAEATAQDMAGSADGLAGGLRRGLKAAGEALAGSGILEGLAAIWQGAAQVLGKILNAVGDFAGKLIEKLKGGDFKGVADLLNAGVFGAIALGIKRFIDGLDSLGDFSEGVLGILEGVQDCLSAYQEKLKAGALLKIAVAVGILAASLVALASIDSDQLGWALTGLAALFGELVGAMALLGKTQKLKTSAVSMIALAVSVRILASALRSLGELDVESLAIGLGGVGGLLAELSIFFRTAKFNKVNTAGIVMLAAGMKILGSACRDLSQLSWEELVKGLSGVGGLLLEVAAFTNLTGNAKHVTTTGLALIEIGAAMKIFASAMADFGGMDWGSIGKGLAGMGGALLEVAIAANLMPKGMVSKGTGLVILGSGLLIVAQALKSFGGMEWEDIGKGLTAMGGALLEVAIAVNLLPKGLMSKGTGLVILGSGLLIVAQALKSFGGMEWEDIGKGLTAMGGALLELAIALKLMKGTLSGSAALLVAAAAMAIIVPCLAALGAVGWAGIAVGLTGLAGAFTVLGIAGKLLGPLAPTILALAGALTLAGAGVALAGAGMVALAAGVASLAAAVSGGGTVIAGGLSLMVQSLLTLIPQAATQFAAAILAFCETIAQGAPDLAGAAEAVVSALAEVMVSCAPKLVNGALEMIAQLLDALGTYVPEFVDSLMDMLIQVIDGMARKTPALVTAISDLVAALVGSVIEVLSQIDPASFALGLAAAGLLAAVIAAFSAIGPMIPGALVGVLGASMVVGEAALLLAVLGGLAQIPGLTWLINEGGDLLAAVGGAIGKLVGGLVGGIMGGAQSQLPKTGKSLGDFMSNAKPFFQGAKELDPSLLKSVTVLAGAMLIAALAGRRAAQAVPAMLGLTIVVTGLAAVLGILAALHVEGSMGAVVSLSVLLLALAGACRILEEVEVDSSVLPAMGILTAVVAGLALILGIMSALNIEASLNNAASLSLLLMAMTGACRILGDVEVNGSALAAMGILTAVVAGLALILGVMSVLNIEASLNNAASLSLLLIAMSGACAILGTVQRVSGSALAAMGILTAVVAGLAVILGAMDVLEVGTSLETAASLSVLLLSMSAACLILTAVGAAGASAFVGVGALVTLVAALGGLMAGICALTADNPTIEEDLDRAVMVMEKIGTGLGAAIGGVVGGVLEGLTAGLPGIGENLTAFMENAGGFFQGAKDVDPETMLGIKYLAEAVLLLTQDKVLNALTSWFTGGSSLAAFGEELEKFGPYFAGFAESVKDIDKETVTIAADSAKVLSEFAKGLPRHGGVLADFLGDNSLSKFGEELALFGPSFYDFAKSMEGIDPDVVTAATAAAQSVAEFAAAIPNQGGILADLFGDNTLSQFGAELALFGPSFHVFARLMTGVDTKVVESAAAAAQSVAKFADEIPNQGGILADLFGDNKLSTFGRELALFGPNFAVFARLMTGVDAGVVTSAASAAQSVADFADKLDTKGGILADLFGEKSLSGFGAELALFGPDFKTFYTAVEGVKKETVDNAVTVFQSVLDLAALVPEDAGWGKKDAGDNLTYFGGCLKTFGEGLSTAMTKVSEKQVSTFAGSIQLLLDLAKQADETDLESFKGLGKTLGEQVVKPFREFTTGSDAQNAYKALGVSVAEGAAAGLDGAGETLKTAGEGAGRMIAQGILAASSPMKAAAGLAGAEAAKNFLARWSSTVKEGGGSAEALGDYAQTLTDALVLAVQSRKRGAGKAMEDAVDALLAAGAAKLLKSRNVLIEPMKKLMAEVVKQVTIRKVEAQTAMSALVKALGDAVADGKKNVIAAVTAMMEEAVEVMASYEAKFINAGGEAAAGFAAGIKLNLGYVASAGAAVGNAALSSARRVLDSHSPSKEFMRLGEDSVEGYALGVEQNSDRAVDAVETVAQEVDGAGDQLGGNMADQVEGTMDAIANSVEDTAKTVSERTAELVEESLAHAKGTLADFVRFAQKNLRDGSLEGMTAEVKGLKQIASTTYSYASGDELRKSDAKAMLIMEQLENKFQEAERALAGEETALAALLGPIKKSSVKDITKADIQAYIDSLGERPTKKDMDDVRSRLSNPLLYYTYTEDRESLMDSLGQMEEELYKKRLEQIETEREQRKISGQEELALYERMLAEYGTNAEKRLELEKKIAQKRIDLKREEYDHSMDWIEQERYYDRMTTVEELAAYKRVQSRYAAGTEERKKMDREVYRLEKEIYEAQEQYVKDLQDARQRAADESAAAEEEYAQRVKEINEDLEEDIARLQESYQNAVESRANSLYQSYGLFDEVKKREAVSGEKLMANLEDQVKQFGNWQDILNSLSAKGLDEELMAELTKMGPAAIDKLDALNKMSAQELDKYAALWSIKHAQARDQATAELEGMRTDTEEEIQRLRDEAAAELEQCRLEWVEKTQQIADELEEEVDRLSREFAKKLGLMKQDSEAVMKNMADTANEILRSGGWNETGHLVVQGLIAGLEAEIPNYVRAVEKLGLAGQEACAGVNEIHSPSRVFDRMGRFIGQGLVNGLNCYRDNVAAAGEDLAWALRGGAFHALRDVSALVDKGLDELPAVTPVMDLSGLGTPSPALAAQLTAQLAGQAGLGFAAASALDQRRAWDGEKLTREVRGLRQDLSELGQRMARMQVVMDTGTLVGELAAPMDSALGKRIIYRERGI